MNGFEVVGSVAVDDAHVMSDDAVAFVAALQRAFGPRRMELLARRAERRASLSVGGTLDFLPATANVRAGDWRVAEAPADLRDRRVEITGPAERKMLINALNCGARVFMADIEDALSPTWANVVGAQADLLRAVNRDLDFTSAEGKRYALNTETATLVVRPRGWHLTERHLTGRRRARVGQPVRLRHASVPRRPCGPGAGEWPGARALLLPAQAGEPPRGAALERRVPVRPGGLGIPRGTIRATVLIETIWGAFEMDEILGELREHAAGLNAGRWDYIFSLIKAFRERPDMVLPDRAQVTMAVPFMRAYTQLLVRTCHRRGAHAIGGMSAFIPNRRQPEVTERALARVREDKQREAGDGFDGTWVAHPDLVAVAQAEFDAAFWEIAWTRSIDCVRTSR